MPSRFLEWLLYNWDFCKSFWDFDMENYHSNLDLTFDLEPFLFLRIFSPEGIGDEKQPYLQTTQSMASLFVF